jgi:hypothetical protein
VSRIIPALLLGVVALAALITAGPTIARLAQALVPLVLVVGIVAVVLRLVHYYTRR